LANTLKPFRLINQPKAYWYIFGAVLIFTATSLIDKWLLSDYKMPPTVLVPIQHFFMAIYFSLFLLVRPTEKKDLNVALKSGWKLILIVSFLTILYRYGHILAIKEGSVALAISVKRTSVFFAALIGGYLFKETNLIYKLFATLIMIAGAVLIIVG
jgi:drug/metabolite transporter (DMT)-like permease